jgi:hypothetical protein
VTNPEGRARVLIAALEGFSFLFISEESERSLDAEAVSKDLVEIFVP